MEKKKRQTDNMKDTIWLNIRKSFSTIRCVQDATQRTDKISGSSSLPLPSHGFLFFFFLPTHGPPVYMPIDTYPSGNARESDRKAHLENPRKLLWRDHLLLLLLLPLACQAHFFFFSSFFCCSACRSWLSQAWRKR